MATTMSLATNNNNKGRPTFCGVAPSCWMDTVEEKDNNKVDEDFETEVFFMKRRTRSDYSKITSTPIEEPAGRKRKRKTSTAANRKKLRSNMSVPEKAANSSAEDSDMDDDTFEENQDMAAFMATMTRQMAKMNESIASMQKNMRTTVNEAIEPLTVRMDTMSRRIDRLENSQIDAENTKSGLEKHIKETVEKAIEKRLPREKRNNAQATYASATNTAANGSASTLSLIHI